MNILSRAARYFQRKSSLSLDLFRQVYGGRESRAGVSVNWQSAIEVATVLACVRVIANGVAQVPFRLYRDDAAGRKLAKAHPLYALLWRRPNGWQTSFEFRHVAMFHVLLTGNAYVWLGRVGSERRIATMELIEPHRVTVRRSAAGVLSYEVRADNGEAVTFAADEIWHWRGPSWNSWLGLDSVKMARDAIGLTIATEQSQAEFHKGGARVSGLLSIDGQVGSDRYTQLAEWLDEHAIGGKRAGKPLVLDHGAKFEPMQMTGVDAQLIETRKHQIEEVCRAFGVMPIMVGHADKTATYASAEQMFLAHVVHTLSPWYERIEQSADVNLIGEADRAAGHYTKFTPNALMRGAAKDRAEFYAKALGAGGHPAWATQNEIRDFEEMERSDDPAADRLNPGVMAQQSNGASNAAP